MAVHSDSPIAGRLLVAVHSDSPIAGRLLVAVLLMGVLRYRVIAGCI